MTAYLVSHWQIGRKMIADHFCFEKDEARDGFVQKKAEKDGSTSTDAYSWLVRHFSWPGDCVIDLLSSKGQCLIGSMGNCRNAI